MESREYRIVEEVQGEHWWWLGRQRIIERLVEKYCVGSGPLRIADVGSGLGANIGMLRRYGAVTALEASEEAVAKIKAKWPPATSVRALQWQSPQPVDDSFDLILLADVLEHIPDDAAAVSWIWDHLAPGGHVILTVPAHRHLWTEMDEVVHHCRRYRAAELRALLSKNFVIRYFSFYNSILYPVKLLFVLLAKARRALFPRHRKRSFNEVPPRLINGIFKMILSSEAVLVGRTPLPFGVSIVAVAQRPNHEIYLTSSVKRVSAIVEG